MPELPEVEALAAYLRERAVGQTVDRIEVAAISALKTYDPPVSAVAGLPVTGATRHGKFLDITLGSASPGDPAALSAAKLHLVVHLARAGRTGGDPGGVRAAAQAAPGPGQGGAHRAGGAGRRRQRLLRRDPACGQAVPVRDHRPALRRGAGPPLRGDPGGADRRGAAVGRAEGGHPEGGEALGPRGPCPDRAALPGLWRHHPGGVFSRLKPAVLPRLPDRRQTARGSAAVAAGTVSHRLR